VAIDRHQLGFRKELCLIVLARSIGQWPFEARQVLAPPQEAQDRALVALDWFAPTMAADTIRRVRSLSNLITYVNIFLLYCH
jgi:hypothetical protein